MAVKYNKDTRSKSDPAVPVNQLLANPAAKGMLDVGVAVPEIVQLKLDQVLDNPHQARKNFDAAAIRNLSISLTERGQLTPIIVRPHETDGEKYYLVAGERRLRAFRLLDKEKPDAGFGKILAIVTTRDDPESLSLLENVTRQNLSVIELADGLESLVRNRGYTLEVVAAILGMTATDVGEHIGLLRLPDEILAVVRTSVPDRFSRSALVELSRTEDGVREELWKRMLEGPVTVSEVRSARKAAKDAPSKNADGIALGALGRNLKAVGKGVEAMAEYRGHMAKEHREGLLKIRARIDELLSESEPTTDVR